MSKKKDPINQAKEDPLKFYRDLVETSQDLIWQCDIEGRYTYLNPAWEIVFGYKLNKMLGKKFSDFQNPEQVKRDMIEFKRLLKGNMVKGFETIHLGKNGNEIHLVFNATFIQDSKGNFCGTRGTAHDITDRINLENAVLESEERFRSLFEKAPLGYQSLDSEGFFIEVNQAWLEILGYSYDEVIGKWFGDFLAPEFVEGFRKQFPSFKEQGHIHTELQMIHKSGKSRYIAFDGKIGYNNNGSFKQSHCILADHTERKRSEENLQKTQKLESLGLLAGGIAHDFNNLMGGVFGYIDMAGAASTEEKVILYLSKAINTIERSRALTQQLLTFAKGGSPIKEIDHLFPFVEETARFALSGANVLCKFDIQQDLWTCNFDKNQIGQVIDNIIINAKQAMPAGGSIELVAQNINLTEKEQPLLARGKYIKISVKDSGIGIPKELISKIFDPFLTTKEKGHGLGLATCYSIINRHKGSIDVESEPGKGSTFKIYLPASIQKASFAIKNNEKKHRGRGTFLVMDDEEVIRETIGDMLKTLGYAVVSKKNGKEAIDFFTTENKANREITGIIFDLTVPGGMGGKAAIKEIRKTNKNIPSFVASGYADDPVMKNPTEHGFTASICKPFLISELSEMLNKYIKNLNLDD